MKPFTFHLLPFTLAAVLLFASCEKDPESSAPSNPEGTVSALVLNEGTWGANNAVLTAIDVEEGTVVDADWFSSKNNRGLGDVAQDILVYGSKIYATVTFSNSLEVIDVHSGAATRVDLGNRRPRYIAATDGKLYITCYSPCSVIRVDTASLTVEATCLLGQYHPEGIAIAQGKAFVASSYQGNSYDNHLYIVDLATFANPTTVTVGMNLSNVKKINDNKIIVAWIGNYSDVPSGSAIIDATTLAVTNTGEALQKMDVYNGKVYGYSVEYDENWNETNNWKVINADGTSEAFPFAVSLDANAYGININPANGDFYITSSDYSTNGDVYCFTPSGTRRFKVEAGAIPSKVLFL